MNPTERLNQAARLGLLHADPSDAFLQALLPVITGMRERIRVQYVNQVRRYYQMLLEKYGPTFQIRDVWSPHRVVYREVVEPSLEYETARNAQPGEYVVRSFYGPKYLDEGKLQANADRYAEAQLGPMVEKIRSKVGLLSDLKFSEWSGPARFRLTGSWQGKSVVLEQDMIVNVSSKGKLFNQWPSHIYVDGKFLSEAAYKRLLAEPV
jgi:hypothetical protein